MRSGTYSVFFFSMAMMASCADPYDDPDFAACPDLGRELTDAEICRAGIEQFIDQIVAFGQQVDLPDGNVPIQYTGTDDLLDQTPFACSGIDQESQKNNWITSLRQKRGYNWADTTMIAWNGSFVYKVYEDGAFPYAYLGYFVDQCGDNPGGFYHSINDRQGVSVERAERRYEIRRRRALNGG